MCFATDSLFIFKLSVDCCCSLDLLALDAAAAGLSCGTGALAGACAAGSIFVLSSAADAATVELSF